jgi:WD40 repeat protein
MVQDWGQVQEESSLAAAVSPDREFLFIGGSSGSLKQFSLSTKKLIKCYKFFQIKGAVTCMEFTRDNRYLITASNLAFKGGGF